jgi:hypothetical protein
MRICACQQRDCKAGERAAPLLQQIELSFLASSGLAVAWQGRSQCTWGGAHGCVGAGRLGSRLAGKSRLHPASPCPYHAAARFQRCLSAWRPTSPGAASSAREGWPTASAIITWNDCCPGVPGTCCSPTGIAPGAGMSWCPSSIPCRPARAALSGRTAAKVTIRARSHMRGVHRGGNQEVS